MSGNPYAAIQQALYDILTSDPTLANKITGVFDFVPDNQDYPFVTIGETMSIPYETFDRYGEEVSTILHIWSRYRGMKQVNEIMEDCKRLLARKDFAVAGWQNISCYHDFSEVIREPDGVTRHGVIRLRILALQEG
jgi:hypothetical protein